MPNGTFFQTAYPFPTQIQTQTQSTRSIPEAALNESTDGESNGPPSALAEAIDDFLGDLERKFKTVSDEILTKRKARNYIIQLIQEDIKRGWRLITPQWTKWPSVVIALRRNCL